MQEAGLPSHLQAHASAAVGASSAAVVGVVGLGDPVMDLVAPNLPLDLLAELDMVPGGCIAVDGEEMARLLSRREVASQLHRRARGRSCAAVHGPFISCLHFLTWASQPCIVSLLFLASLARHLPACLPACCRLPGGSAANVCKGIAGIAAQGSCTVSFVGQVGRDALGEDYRARLQAAGVQAELVEADSGAATATCLCLVRCKLSREATGRNFVWIEDLNGV